MFIITNVWLIGFVIVFISIVVVIVLLLCFIVLMIVLIVSPFNIVVGIILWLIVV